MSGIKVLIKKRGGKNAIIICNKAVYTSIVGDIVKRPNVVVK